jgi:hypothetical protein
MYERKMEALSEVLLPCVCEDFSEKRGSLAEDRAFLHDPTCVVPKPCVSFHFPVPPNHVF